MTKADIVYNLRSITGQLVTYKNAPLTEAEYEAVEEAVIAVEHSDADGRIPEKKRKRSCPGHYAKTAHLKDEDIKALMEQGMSQFDISLELDVSQSTIAKRIKNMRERGEI